MESSRKLVIQSLIGWVLVLGLISGAVCQADWVDPHNAARSAVNVPSLTWSSTVASYATEWANNLASRGCTLEHNAEQKYGENIFGNSPATTPGDAVNSWVSEKPYYDYASNTCVSQECRHYTQVVWKNSLEVGCASARCADGGIISVCNYNPPGNYIGERPY